jgi:DNA primase
MVGSSTCSHDLHDQDRMMDENLQHLKQQFPLLDYLRARHWNARRAGHQQEFVGLCPFHQETRPSFYVNARKNLFYCHGCGRGGDLIRWIQLSLGLSFRESVDYLKRELGQVAAPPIELLEQTAAFYQCQLHRHAEAAHYLAQRGLRDPNLIQQLHIGYAPGGNLRRHLANLGYSLELLLQAGLINDQGRDAFCRRVMFPCSQQGRVTNLYGRSIGTAFPHRFLPRSKSSLFAWESVRQSSTIILVEGLFDLAVLWQAGFRNTTCAFGTHLTPAQFSQLCDRRGRQLYLVFDRDANHAGQQAAATLAQRLNGAGLEVRIVELPDDHDPNSYFLAGATVAEFTRCLDRAHSTTHL